MKKTKKPVLPVLLAVLFLAGSCASKDEKVRIGSKDFTENLILAELYALRWKMPASRFTGNSIWQVPLSTPLLQATKLISTLRREPNICRVFL